MNPNRIDGRRVALNYRPVFTSYLRSLAPNVFSKSLAFLSILFCSFASAQEKGPAIHRRSERLDRTNLLLYHNSKGEVVAGRNARSWQKRREEILNGMQQIMGPLPGKEKRCPLDMKVEEEVDCGSYVRQLITYASEPGSRVPAYLLIPKGALDARSRGKRGKSSYSGVLALHSTEMKLGHKVAVGVGGKDNRNYGGELAERGYVVLAPSYPLMAIYQPDLAALGYSSGTMKAVWDNMRGIDLLASLPYVRDRHKFGAIGHSLGGHNTIYTAVFDPRIKVIVTSCGFDSFLDYKDGNITGWTQTRYMPKLKDYANSLADIPFDFYELIGALAPRVCFINAPKGDSNFKWQSVDAIVKTARPIYELYDAEQNLRVEHPDCAHDFPDEMRETAYRLFDENLK